MKKLFCFFAAAVFCCGNGRAQNPLIHDQYTADPSARVFGDSIYVYPSHDIHWGPGKGRPNWFNMEDYHVFSSPDGVAWTDHGMVISQKTAPWVDTSSYSMWAPDCVFRNGKYYLYFPSRPKDTSAGKHFAIGVAVGDHPGGPFIPQAEPIKGVAGIDPNVFIDKDGQAYLYWAEGNLYAAKLREDMLGLASEPVVLSQLPSKGLKEGPWVFERKGIYYLTYPHVAARTERLEYAVGDNPMGPFQFKGVIMDESPTGCWTNHHSVFSFKGQWYLFYHHNDLSPDFDKNRSIRADSLFFEADGSIRKVEPTFRGIGLTQAGRPIQLDRYTRIEDARSVFLDSMERMKGWKVVFDAAGGWVQYNSVNFGRTAWRSVVARVMSSSGGVVEVRVDGRTGPVVGEVAIPAGGEWHVLSVPVKGKLSGIHPLFVVARSAGLQADWIRFDSTADSHVARNPIIDADVPDMSIIRVGGVYYMSSTTMHMSPGVPIMKSTDLVNWKMVSYAYDVLDDADELNLGSGKSMYGRGSWASSLRYHNGVYYVSTFSGTTGKTYIYTTGDIEHGPWKAVSFKPSLHDHSLFFDDDGKAYMVFGGGRIMLAELKDDLSGIREGTTPQPIIDNATVVAGPNIGLPAEGSQLFRINEKYYLFNITWPKGGMRTVIIHRADKLTGPWEGRVALQDKGVAQGGLVNTPDGEWYAYLFRDYGSVGRVPYLVPVSWRDGWPVLGVDGKVPDSLDLPGSQGLDPGIVASDEFTRRADEPALPLVWQWNHNPDNRYWSVAARQGWLRLTTGRVDTSVLFARNTLTQRTFGPVCWGATAIDVSHMKDGDRAGLLLLQRRYGWVGVKMEGGVRSIVMINEGVEAASVPLGKGMVFLRADCDFTDKTDKAKFYYSLDGKKWVEIGTVLQMAYTLPHFMGYRFGLFNYATKEGGGYVDFDWFREGF